ncbi:MAG: hypothetical protein VYC34_10515 [Planctomycetota bacterium]|nr:hypothetical protein [Planctomycetota bacterium]
MFIQDLTSADAIPVLSATMRMAGQRQRYISHNIANLSTPDFRPVDVPVAEFRDILSDAVDRRREKHDGVRGDLDLKQTRHFRTDDAGHLNLRPSEVGDNLLFHDRNDRSLESLMQDLVENAGAYRVAADLLRSRFDLLNAAIRERIG